MENVKRSVWVCCHWTSWQAWSLQNQQSKKENGQEVEETKDKLELCLSLTASNFDDAGYLNKLTSFILKMHLHLAQH